MLFRKMVVVGLRFYVELQEYILTALASKTVIFVTHQVEFLPAADLILVLGF